MIDVVLVFLIWLIALQVFWLTVTFYHSHKVRELIFPSFIIIVNCGLITVLRMVKKYENELTRYVGGTRKETENWVYTLGALVFVITLIFLITELKRMSREITGASIKEGADLLPAGLLYYEDSGIIVIANKTMYELAEVRMGKTLLSGVLFWEDVMKLPGVPLYARMPGANLVWESDVLRP